MTGHAAVYSIIQYCPDVARSEGVNVGVAIVCPELGCVRVRLSGDNKQVKKRFGSKMFDDARLTSAKNALKSRLETARPTESDFGIFISREANNLVMLPPRPMIVTEIESDLRDLFEELVDTPARLRQSRVPPPNISKYFDPILMSGVPVQTNVTVSVPLLNKKIIFPYSYRNGIINYIKPQGFSPDEESAIRTASDLGVKGMMLWKHTQGDTKSKLVVVANFKEPKFRPVVDRIFHECQVRLVPKEELPEYADEVRKQAHR